MHDAHAVVKRYLNEYMPITCTKPGPPLSEEVDTHQHSTNHGERSLYLKYLRVHGFKKKESISQENCAKY